MTDISPPPSGSKGSARNDGDGHTFIQHIRGVVWAKSCGYYYGYPSWYRPAGRLTPDCNAGSLTPTAAMGDVIAVMAVRIKNYPLFYEISTENSFMK